MTPFKYLFTLYGIAALFSTTRKLHEDNAELKTQLQLVTQQSGESLVRAENRFDGTVDRILLTRGVPKDISSDLTTTVTKRHASRHQQRIKKAQERELNYYHLSHAGEEQVSDSDFDANALLEKAAAIAQPEL